MSKKILKANLTTAGAFGFALTAVIGAVSSQASVLEEVVVTAQKREQNLQDVGVSVTAYSGDQMKALGVTNTTEITEQIAGLQMTSFSPNLVTFNIRGVSQNNFTDNNEAPVAVYIDDAYVASMNAISGQLFDIDRVEVLRGPQGTLFGRNATGGVIHYVTKGADDTEFNGYVEGTYSDYSKYSIETAFGGSFSDSARYRIALRKEESDGYIESALYPQDLTVVPVSVLPPPSGQDLGGADGYALRAAFQFDLSDRATLSLSAKYSEDTDVPTGGYSFLPYGDASIPATDPADPNAYVPPEFTAFVTDVIGAPAGATSAIFFCNDQINCFTPVDTAGRTTFKGDSPEPFKNYSDYAGYMDRDTTNVSARLDWELSDNLELVSITNYSATDKFYTEDGDGIPAPIIEFTTIADFSQLSQEIRLSSEGDNLRWTAGAYFLDMETDADVVTVGAPVGGVAAGLGFFDNAGNNLAVNARVAQDYLLESRNWSVFGQVEFDLTDALTLIGGYRYSQDDKDLDFTTTFQADALITDVATGATDGTAVAVETLNLAAAVAAAGGDPQNEVDYGDYAARLQLDYRMSDSTLLFASYNRGIKGGNFAPSANVTLDQIRHEEEVLDAFELGVKTEFLDGRARLNATAFYYDYSDYQAFTFSGGTPSVSNAQAENQGAEIELTLLPTENWDILLGVSLQDSSVDNVETPQSQGTPVGFSVDWPVDFLNDMELPNTPDVSFNYLVRYNFDVGQGNLAFQFDGVYYGDQYLEVTNGAAAFQEAYNVANVSATYATDAWSLRAWVKNVADEEYKQYALDLGILGGTAVYGAPQWWGVTGTYNF
ncbi:TonB-dependent receptor [Luminiphilus sp.]|jgi:iron complex outermembrane receptor protein|nr:TonB-dependent receptor [Luminiphilus sp.]